MRSEELDELRTLRCGAPGAEAEDILQRDTALPAAGHTSSLCPPAARSNRAANVPRRGEILGRAARRRPAGRGEPRAALGAVLAPPRLARTQPARAHARARRRDV